jgi:molecular chaperone IbpA
MVSNFGIETVRSIFDDPFFIGFNKRLDDLQKTHVGSLRQSYPPYNLVEIDDDNYELSLAVAGFKKDEIEITIDNGHLVIKGDKAEEENSNVVYKGIAARKFTRTFALGEYMEVNRAEMADGILSVFVERNVPEEKKPKTIKIK